MSSSAKSKIQVQNINSNSEKTQTVEVLYQKIANRWYAFALDGEELFVGSLSEEEINAADAQGIEKFIVETPVGPNEQNEAA